MLKIEDIAFAGDPRRPAPIATSGSAASGEPPRPPAP
jgi:hypothetical protein